MNDYVKWLILCLVSMLSGGLVLNTSAQESSTVEQDAAARPSMPALFFTHEQRQNLEVLRQPVVPPDNIQVAEPPPLVEEIIAPVTVMTKVRQRTDNIAMEAYLRNHKNGKTVLWLNGVQYRLNEKSEFLNKEGIMNLSAGDRGTGAIIGVDKFNDTEFVLDVGQQLRPDGTVDELYPVVIINPR